MVKRNPRDGKDKFHNDGQGKYLVTFALIAEHAPYTFPTKPIYLPAPGSVIAIALIHVPSIMRGMNFFICSFDPN